MSNALVLVSHGSVEELDDLPAFLRNVRRGHDPSPELVVEIRRRYEAIGGRSPLNAINRELAQKLEKRLSVPVRSALRLWHPDPGEVLAELAQLGIARVALVPLAQHSADVYRDAVVRARDAAHDPRVRAMEITSAANWGQDPALLRAFARRVEEAFTTCEVPRERIAVVLSAHSLPIHVIEAGDAYEREVRASAATLQRMLGLGDHECWVSFQSQGQSPVPAPGGAARPGTVPSAASVGGAGGNAPRTSGWLGPDLRETFDAIAATGRTCIVIAPVGFLADHVEILYDIDIEARGWAEARGQTVRRAASLNADDDFVDLLVSLASPLLARAQR